MTTTQLDLLGAPVADPARDVLLSLIAGDPRLADHRAAVVDAIRASVRPDGTTSANAWRDRVPYWVRPSVVGAVVNGLARAGVLRPTGQYERSTDVRSRNGSKPVPAWRWVDPRT